MNTNILRKAENQNLLLREEVYKIVGAAMEVHSSLGPGFLEAVYQEALEIEFSMRGIPFYAQKELPIYYKNKPLKKAYIADFVAFDKVIVEIKALDQLSNREESQLINYLKATEIEVGLLINFGGEKLEWERRILSKNYSRPFA